MSSSFKRLAFKSCLSFAFAFAIIAVVMGLGASAKVKIISGAYQSLTLATFGTAGDYELHVTGRNLNTNHSATMTTKLRRGTSYGSSTVLRTHSKSCSYGQTSDIIEDTDAYLHYWGSSTQIYSGYSETKYGSLPNPY
ncbi:MAG: hypothetical protein IKQ71_00910 [Lachnospiraceae bacterium]|nr:hypothetical protein [Lachnospiraceae bacterium]